MEILLQVILILVNAFFAGTEMAVVSLNATKLRKMQEEGETYCWNMPSFCIICP